MKNKLLNLDEEQTTFSSPDLDEEQTESPFHRRISMKNKLPDPLFLVRFIVVSPALIFARSFFRSESIRSQCAAAHPPHSINPLIVFIKHITFCLCHVIAGIEDDEV
ncbi:hypothetical protein Hdeb2414_s0003g00104031 [Helianthus debilis subsp. tardiflorus]